jgi:hypothetical protein
MWQRVVCYKFTDVSENCTASSDHFPVTENISLFFSRAGDFPYFQLKASAGSFPENGSFYDM